MLVKAFMSIKKYDATKASKSLILLGLVLPGIPSMASVVSPKAVVLSEFISAAPPTAQSHASTLVQTPQAWLLRGSAAGRDAIPAWAYGWRGR